MRQLRLGSEGDLPTGFILVLPVVFHQAWQFIAPGLTRKGINRIIPINWGMFLFIPEIEIKPKEA